MVLLKLFLFTLFTLEVICGPRLPISPTKGGVVPVPQEINQQNQFFILRPSTFRLNVTKYSCSILDEAVVRYWKLISKSLSSSILERISEDHTKTWIQNPDYLGRLDLVNVQLDNPCKDTELPHLNITENYTIALNETNQIIRASSVWGILRGLETFSQLIYKADDQFTLVLNSTYVRDYPRFPHRGLHLDTARHFIPLKYILKTIEAMSYNKMNVFHWHIVDDQSFPYKSMKFPELSDQGAYHPVAAVYEPEDVQTVIEFARKRGIRVLVEFDTPGHTLSWGIGVADILTKCVGISDEYGPMDPSKPNLYTFLKEFFQEISEVFPDGYVHLGGDEVPFDCWQSNPNITKFMAKLNITGNYPGLESYFIKNLIDIVTSKGLQSIVWEEVFDNGVKLTNSTIVHVWKDDFHNTLNAATKAGQQVLLSSCWYLDHLNGLADWRDYYACDPYDFPGNNAQKDLVLGGEACMWSEAVNQFNVISRVWPRACAAAEKLWSSITPRDNSTINHEHILYMASRLEEHTCRLNDRGIEAQPPSGPGYCYY